jgi:hypothetical protein
MIDWIDPIENDLITDWIDPMKPIRERRVTQGDQDECFCHGYILHFFLESNRKTQVLHIPIIYAISEPL